MNDGREGAASLLRVTADDPEYRRQAAAEADFWRNVHPMSLEAVEGGYVEPVAVQRYVNERFTGDPRTDWTKTIASRGTFRRGLLLGVSSPQRERSVLATNRELHVTLLDISAESIERRARELEKSFPGRVASATADLNFLELEPESCDVIVSSSTIHHVTNLEYLAFQINRGLTRNGFLFVEDYVGERRFVFSEAKRRLYETVYGRDIGRRPGREPGLVWHDTSDLSPFCAVRSDEILAVFRHYLDEVQVRTAASLTIPMARSQPLDIDEVWARTPAWKIQWALWRQRLGFRRKMLEIPPEFLDELRLVGDAASDAGIILPGLAFAVYRKASTVSVHV